MSRHPEDNLSPDGKALLDHLTAQARVWLCRNMPRIQTSVADAKALAAAFDDPAPPDIRMDLDVYVVRYERTVSLAGSLETSTEGGAK
jgi:hypothetical protein